MASIEDMETRLINEEAHERRIHARNSDREAGALHNTAGALRHERTADSAFSDPGITEIDQLIDETPVEKSKDVHMVHVPNSDRERLLHDDDDVDSEDEFNDGPKAPWHVRLVAWLRAFPHKAWHWMKNNRIKTLVLFLLLGLLIFLIVEVARGAVTAVMTGMLERVKSLGIWVRDVSGACPTASSSCRAMWCLC